MQVRQKTWQAFKYHFLKAYRHYQIRKKAIAAAHRYRASENHTQEADDQLNTVDALQTLTWAAMKGTEAMMSFTRINLTLSHIITQAQEIILVLSEQLHVLQTHSKAKTLIT